jgi:RNA polymerase sigma-70 factor (ECF subfamily)
LAAAAVGDVAVRCAGRSTLRTWLLRILVNTAKTRAHRERRSIPFSALDGSSQDAALAVEPVRFQTVAQRWPGHWQMPPHRWDGQPELRLLSAETQTLLRATIAGLPDAPQQVIRLRDMPAWSAS